MLSCVEPASVTGKENEKQVVYSDGNIFLLKNAVFWDVAPCRSCVNRCFGGTYRLLLLGSKIASNSSYFVVTTVKTSNHTFFCCFTYLITECCS
jgi:hypothetical protein